MALRDIHAAGVIHRDLKPHNVMFRGDQSLAMVDFGIARIVDDPGITLLRFDAERGEFRNNAGTRGVQYAFQAAKAYVTGEPPRPGADQHGRVRL